MRSGHFYDTETTGIPNYHEPSGGETQPHLVQLAAKLIDLDDRECLGEMNVIIKPDGWTIPQDTIDVHGITNEQAMDEGIPEVQAVEMFFELFNQGGDEVVRIGHNESFDRRLIRIATKRYSELEQFEDPWHSLAKDRSFCTCNQSKKHCKLPPTEKMKKAKRFSYKNPRLSEAYEHFTGLPLENAHDAMVDVDACIEIYFHLQELMEDD